MASSTNQSSDCVFASRDCQPRSSPPRAAFTRRSGGMSDTQTMIADTHAHLTSPEFDADLRAVVERARQWGVTAIATVSEDLADAQRVVQLSREYPSIHAAAGLSPANLDREQAQAVCAFIRQQRHALVAIGEVGLDYWVVQDHGDRELQREIFSSFIDLSVELGLPLNVHSRSCGGPTIEMLLERGAQKVQLHAFDGKASRALPGVEAGYLLSIPPSIVRSRQKQKLVEVLPLSALLVESDSPALGPQAQERNEPANVLVAIDSISQIKGVSRQQVIETIAANTQRLYGDLPKPGEA